ncbi:MAG: hypothetical protein QJR08_03645 [Bacillota bacterium]|nr:hypothetical protein [Bacillota bacterium]
MGNYGIKLPVKAVDARRWYRLGEEDTWHVVDATGRVIAICVGWVDKPGQSPVPSVGQTDAEAIAAALNRHDTLTDALREARGALSEIEWRLAAAMGSATWLPRANDIARIVMSKIDAVLGSAAVEGETGDVQ